MTKDSSNLRKAIKRLHEYPDILTVEDASEMLGVSTKTVYKLLRQGCIANRKVGRSYRIPKSSVISYLGLEK